jgi:hypothetical protein
LKSPNLPELKDTKIDATLEPVKDEMELRREALSAIIPELGQVTSLADESFTQQPSLESMYEFSETRKVLEEFFSAPPQQCSEQIGQTPNVVPKEDKVRSSRKTNRDLHGDGDQKSSNNAYRLRRGKANNGYGFNLLLRPNTASSASSLSFDQETLSTEELGDTETGVRVSHCLDEFYHFLL